MKEMRTIGFDEREAIMAILDLMRKQRQKLPPGQIVGLQINSSPISADLVVEDDHGERITIHKNATELAASLVNYCIERRVKLPTGGRKFVEVIAGGLNLIIFLEEAQKSEKRLPRVPRRVAAFQD